LGTALSEVFPTSVRYTGASVSFNIAGIVGGSFAPAIASWLANTHGLAYVGYYLSLAGLLTAVASWFLPRKVD
ncbi:MAG: MFS transporter, partial [Steroidobacter sp.]